MRVKLGGRINNVKSAAINHTCTPTPTIPFSPVTHTHTPNRLLTPIEYNRLPNIHIFTINCYISEDEMYIDTHKYNMKHAGFFVVSLYQNLWTPQINQLPIMGRWVLLATAFRCPICMSPISNHPTHWKHWISEGICIPYHTNQQQHQQAKPTKLNTLGIVYLLL